MFYASETFYLVLQFYGLQMAVFACRHVYQFSKAFVGEQTSLSRSASSAELCLSPRRVATTTASLLPSRTCLVADRVMTPSVPASNSSDVAPVFLSSPPLQSPSGIMSGGEPWSSPASLPDDASSEQVHSVEVTAAPPVNTATESSGRLRQSQVSQVQM